MTEWARAQGIHPQTAYRWFHAGTLPVPAVRVNRRTILVSPDAATKAVPAEALGLYVRVSSHDQRGDLDLRWLGFPSGQPRLASRSSGEKQKSARG